MKIKSLKLNTEKCTGMSKGPINPRGIALIEALMAISIIMIAIMAPIDLSLNAVKVARHGLNKITADNLANQQVEMLINYKKSLDIYCFNNINNTDCNGEDGFDLFVDNLTSFNCSVDTPLTPCYIDDTSFFYTLPAAPSVIPKTSCQVILQDNDIAKCDNGSTAFTKDTSVFTRKLYIDNLDNTKSTEGVNINMGIRLVSVVCINDKSCVPGDKKSITMINFIYR
jgi:hypothetical protein